MDLRKKYRDACENLGWGLTDEGDGNIYVNQPSPKGEDFGFSVPASTSPPSTSPASCRRPS